MVKQMLIELLVFIDNNRGKFFGALLGFIIGVLILIIGFFKALFILICTYIGYALGSKSYKNINFKKLLERILPPGGIN